ncbi:CEP44-like protein [Mya arenaria]|uniref:Centrosomal protein of 44 kDa n=1 Tax=Mya arenaria TaxID=6604 RepID=A0ABY7DTU2_MYAAR|nr:CEP44-like protein [Mya arenaria]
MAHLSITTMMVHASCSAVVRASERRSVIVLMKETSCFCSGCSWFFFCRIVLDLIRWSDQNYPVLAAFKTLPIDMVAVVIFAFLAGGVCVYVLDGDETGTIQEPFCLERHMVQAFLDRETFRWLEWKLSYNLLDDIKLVYFALPREEWLTVCQLSQDTANRPDVNCLTIGSTGKYGTKQSALKERISKQFNQNPGEINLCKHNSWSVINRKAKKKMATGDLLNNIRKMRKKLKDMKYMEDINISGISEGTATAYLPLYHFAFTSYCPAVAELILSKDIELFGASRHIFLQTTINKRATGVRQSSAQTSRSSIGVPKSKSLCGKVSPRIEERTSNSARIGRHNAPASTQSHAPQVVNELIASPDIEPRRHISHVSPQSVPVRHVAQMQDKASSSYSSWNSEVQGTVRHVTIRSPRETHLYSPEITSDGYEPSILEIRAPASDSVLQGPVASQQEQLTEVTSQVASLQQTVSNLMTNVQSQLEMLHEVGVSGGGDQVTHQLDKVIAQLTSLAARMTLVENRVSIIEAKLETVHGSGDTALITPQNIHRGRRNPAAEAEGGANRGRENHLGNYDEPNSTLMSEATGGSQPSALNMAWGDSDNQEAGLQNVNSPLFEGPGSSFDISLNYSPIRKMTNGIAGQLVSANEDTFAMETEDDARRSSTPTLAGTLTDSSLHFDCSHIETKDMAARINDIDHENDPTLPAETRWCKWTVEENQPGQQKLDGANGQERGTDLVSRN